MNQTTRKVFIRCGLTTLTLLSLVGVCKAQDAIDSKIGLRLKSLSNVDFYMPPKINASENAKEFLQRPDVQRELSLTLLQRNALNGLETRSQWASSRVLNRPTDTTASQLSGYLLERIYNTTTPLADDLNRSYINSFWNIANNSSWGDLLNEDSLSSDLRSVLRRDQLKRLQELYLQWCGPVVLSHWKVRTNIKLSDKHQEEIDKLVNAFIEKRDAIRNEREQELEFPFSFARREITRLKKSAEERILATLSEEEKQRWDEAQGKPFKFRIDQKNDWKRLFAPENNVQFMVMDFDVYNRNNWNYW